MIQFKNKKVYEDNKLVDFNGLNNSHIVWHLQEMYKPERFINNLYETYTMPDKINHMSLAEGVDFDALLVDDKMFRYTKLTEEDRSEVQDYINKYAYATALLKLHECSKVIGCGLSHNYTIGETYTFISKSYDKLFENVYTTKEKGKLVEGFGTDNKLNIYEGVNSYIHGLGDKRIVENWKCDYNHNNIDKYSLVEAVQNGTSTIVKFTDRKGVQYEAIYENTNAKLLNGGVNLSRLLDRNNLVEAYRVGTLNEYQEPFTISDATILSYGKSNDKLQLVMMDAYGNKGTLFITLNIPVDKFLKKYKKDLDAITSSMSFSDGVEDTVSLLNKAEGDIASMSRIKGKEVVASDSESSALPYQVKGLVPDVSTGGEIIVIDRKDKTKFKVLCTKNGEPYSVTYTYTGDDIVRDINDLQNETDDYDFNRKSDIISFFSLLNSYGRNPKTYKRGISTAGRNYQSRKKVEGDLMEEAEGVQTTDIAPKLDQEVGGLIKVTMKRKKKKVTESDDMFNISDLLIESVSEKDAYYGARGFIKDENGRYHFGDYYLTESGKVVHKSKLKESYYVTEFNSDGTGIDTRYFDSESEAAEWAESENKKTGNEFAVYNEDNGECIYVYDRIDESADYSHKYRCVSAGYETIKTFDTKEEAIEFAKNNSQVYSVMLDLYKDGKLERVGTSDIWSKEDLSESSYEEKKDEAIATAKDIMTKIANKVGNADDGIYPTWRSKGYCAGTIVLDNNTVRINVTYYFKKYMSNKGTINIEVAPNVTGYNVNRGCYVGLFYNSVDEAVNGAYEAVTIARNIVKEKDIDKKNELVQQLKSMKNELNESFDPTGYTKAIEAINAGIETDEDKEALQKYLQDLVGYIRSIAEDYDVLVEGEKEANDAYYKVNEVTQALIKVKPFIEGNDELEKIYSDIMIELNNLQTSVYKNKLDESNSDSV